MSYCCCPVVSWKQEDLDAFLAKQAKQPTEWSLQSLKEHPLASGGIDIATIRAALCYEVPFRVDECPSHSKVCCGQCTRTCSNRCVQDVLNRVSMMCWNFAHGLTSEADEPYLVHLMTWAAGNAVDRDGWSELVKYLKVALKPGQNYKIKEYMDKYGESNPNKYDYAPAAELDLEESARRKKTIRQMDKETGAYLYRSWPDSGLCPYCLPKTTINKRYAGGGSR